jgi:hypothetical protein
MTFNQTANSFTRGLNIEGTTALLDDSGLNEEDLEKIQKEKQALIEEMDENDELKKIMSR